MVGTTISHYKITDKLCEGRTGVTNKTEDTSLDRPVALKFLAAHLVADEDIRKRFEREAKAAAAALDHPNIYTVYEIDEADGRNFMAMAYLEGREDRRRPSQTRRKLSTSLRRFRRANGSAPPPHTPTHRRQEDRTLSLGVR